GSNGCPTGRRFAWAGRSIPTPVPLSAERPPRRLARLTRETGGSPPLLSAPYQRVISKLWWSCGDDLRRAAAEPSERAGATLHLIVAGGQRPLPGEQQATGREKRHPQLREYRQGADGPQGGEARALAVSRVVAKGLGTVRDHIDGRQAQLVDELRQCPCLFADRLDQHPGQ